MQPCGSSWAAARICSAAMYHWLSAARVCCTWRETSAGLKLWCGCYFHAFQVAILQTAAACGALTDVITCNPSSNSKLLPTTGCHKFSWQASVNVFLSHPAWPQCARVCKRIQEKSPKAIFFLRPLKFSKVQLFQITSMMLSKLSQWLRPMGSAASFSKSARWEKI